MGWYPTALDIENIAASLRSWFSAFFMTEAFSANVTLNGNHFSSKNHISSPPYVRTNPRVGIVRLPGQPSALMSVRSICLQPRVFASRIAYLLPKLSRYSTTMMIAPNNLLRLKP
jgi:hypothetical protein